MKLEIDFKTPETKSDDELAEIVEYLSDMIRDGYIRGQGNDFDWFINKDSE